MLALVFPGQGSQHVGMGTTAAAHSPAATAALREADEVLGFALTRLMVDGPEEELKATEVAQPALLAAGYANWLAVRELLPEPAFVAGHSLGEYTALVIAGALDYPTALRLVRRRGELMRDAAAARPGGMAAVMGLDAAVVAELCAAAPGVVAPANYNAPGQVVVSGEPAALAAAGEAAKAAGGKVIELAVSGAFHSPLMQPAAEALREELAVAAFNHAAVPVVQNVTAAAEIAPAALREGLARQVTGSVRWTESVLAMRDAGVTRMVEGGPGKVLTGLLRRIAPEVRGYALDGAAALEGLAEWLASTG
ncbi:MAG: ACP S-malonyltransferase [Armatimonadetes bacterium]|nr:ACP S-malonyltransferase [Armatimonadota bacterium]